MRQENEGNYVKNKKEETELLLCTEKTTGHKLSNDGIFEALIKQFGEIET